MSDTPVAATKAAVPPHRSSQAGIDLIVTGEDSGQAYYTKRPFRMARRRLEPDRRHRL
jgi:hypothetical protein